MRKIISVCLLWASFAGASCNPSCIEGSGSSGEESRTPGNFTAVAMDIPANVVINKGSATEIKITAPENIRKLITTKVTGDHLRIESSDCFNTEEPVRIEITMAELTDVEISGSGSIVVNDTFQVKTSTYTMTGSGHIVARTIAATVNAEVSGSGSVTLIGSANEMNTELAGSGDLDARNLPCNKADVTVAGSGNIRLYAIEGLKAEIAGSGTVYYKGNPDVKTSITGSGKVVSQN